MLGVWGELIPIWSRVLLDFLALLLEARCVYSSFSQEKDASGFEGVACLLIALMLTAVTSGSFTNRWTLTFPMIPFLALQIVLLLVNQRRSEWMFWGFLRVMAQVGSVICFLVGALLSVLFPAVQLPTASGPYNMGVVDMHLPVDSTKLGHVIARIVYPTAKQRPTGGVPYLNPRTALEFCKATMEMGAPDPLKKFSFMLHNYRLIRLPMIRNAAPLAKQFPICIFSHGLGGTNYVYSHQIMSLVSQGYIVLSIDHTDASASIVQLKDGTILWRDDTIGQLHSDGKEVEYVRARRSQTELRVEEMLSATIALRRLNKHNIAELESLQVSFVGKMDVDQVIFMGHSFGGATAVSAACRLPSELDNGTTTFTIIAHEPAMDWAPDNARKALFPPHKLRDSSHSYSGGTGGYMEEEEEDADDSTQPQPKTPLDKVNMLFLYSDEWAKQNWGGSHLIQCMHRRGQLMHTHCEVGVITNSKHNEFSDINMLTPLWLARGVGLTGPRNPVDTSQEIAARTHMFLQSVLTDKE